MNNPNANNNNGQKPLRHLMQHSAFRRIFDEAQRLQRLQSIFQQVLDNELGQQCHIAQLQDGCLKLVVNTAAWAARVRYATPLLIASLRKVADFQDLHMIECRVDPINFATANVSNKKTALNTNSMQLIVETANHIKDPALREVLLKLAGSKPSQA